MVEAEDINELPVAVYLVSVNGSFLYGNRMLRDFLGLPLTGEISSFSISDFYMEPQHREHLLAKVHEAERQGGKGDKQVTSFRIRGREHIVAIFCQPKRGGQGLEGYLGCIVDVTNDERKQRLLDLLPAGVYQVDKDDKIVRVNEALVRLLYLSDTASMKGLVFGSLFADQGVPASIKEKTGKNQKVERLEAEMNRGNKQKFFASLNAIPVFSRDGIYEGYEGTIEDVTQREQYRIILTELPLGTYMVHVQDGRDIIVNCNEQFARMFDYANASDLVGQQITDLHKEDRDYSKFMRALSDAHARGEPLLGYWLKTVTHTGKRLALEVNCRVRTDKEGNIVGRIGVVRDVSNESALRKKVKTFTADIGNVLHTYSSLLVMVRTSLEPICDSLALDLSIPASEVNREGLEGDMESAVGSMRLVLVDLLSFAVSPQRNSAFTAEEWEELKGVEGMLEQFRARIPIPEFRPPTLRDYAHKVRIILDNARGHSLPRELMRNLKTEAKKLERICCLLSLVKVGDAVIEMDYQVRALREYVTKGVRREESRVLVSLSDIVSQAISNLTEFARSRKVELRRVGEMKYLVNVIERDLVRAVTNLLHNAIKYSWSRSAGELPWVAIRCRTEGREVHLEIENYGVPIPKDEIRTGHIFHVGMRGRLASDRGRIGTGIGLADARDVAHNHEGDIEVESRPASYGREGDFSRPFITTAKLMLPLVGVEKTA